MTATLISFTQRGSRLSVRLGKFLAEHGYSVEQYAMSKYCDLPELQPIAPDLTSVSAKAFASKQLLVYIGATGIAVRAIAALVKDKKTDPAVICIDELGKFVIPLLSGHIGGANRLASLLAAELQATAVITTATDINRLPAIDEWATAHNLYITDMSMAKCIAAGLLDGERIGIANLTEYDYELPDGFVRDTEVKLGVVIAENTKVSPYAQTLFLLPRNIYLGIGCRRGTTMGAIESLVMDRLAGLDISIERVAALASIDLKANEVGLLEFAAKHKIVTEFYSAEQLLAVPGEFSASEFVRSVTGVDNVCERAALLKSAGRLIAAKCSRDGVTVAVGIKN